MNSNLNDFKNLKIKILLVISVIFGILFGVFFYTFYQSKKDELEQIKENHYKRVKNSFTKNQELHLKNRYFEESKKFLTLQMIEAMKEKKRKKLQELALPLFQSLQKNDQYLQIIQFHLKDGTSFLRLHNLEHFGDLIAEKRKMLQDIHHTQKEVSGFEYGEQGISYRVITPVFYKNEYIGAFEIGVSPKKILDHVSFFNTIEGVIKFEGEHNQSIQYGTIKSKKLLEFIQLSKDNTEYESEHRHISLYSFDIVSYGGETIGKFLFLNDFTSPYHDFLTLRDRLILVGIIGFLVILVVFYYIFNFENYFDRSRFFGCASC